MGIVRISGDLDDVFPLHIAPLGSPFFLGNVVLQNVASEGVEVYADLSCRRKNGVECLSKVSERLRGGLV